MTTFQNRITVLKKKSRFKLKNVHLEDPNRESSLLKFHGAIKQKPPQL